MKLYGLALIPNKEFINTLVKWRETHNLDILPPSLGRNINIPHTTILQCPFDSDKLDFSVLKKIKNDILTKIKPNKVKSIYIQPKNWLFLDYYSDTLWNEIQNIALSYLEKKILVSTISIKQKYDGYSELEIYNYKRYGYRYIDKSFRPHITLGQVKQEKKILSKDLVHSFNLKIKNKKFEFTDLVFYEAGTKGALVKIIEKIPL